MSRSGIQELGSGKYKRTAKRRIGLFIDGVGLDRATRRLERKVDLARLVTGLVGGLKAEIGRYYTLIPHEDDARQLAFLDAVEKAGLEVVVKRLPPKGVKRQVSMDVHIATDLVCYSQGYFDKEDRAQDSLVTTKRSEQKNGVGHAVDTVEVISGSHARSTNGHTPPEEEKLPLEIQQPTQEEVGQAKKGEIHRITTVVCPTRELSYAIYMSHQLGSETFLADFGLYGASDGWKGVDRWIDLSASETIWR